MKRISVIKYLLVFFLFAGMGCEEHILDPTLIPDSTFTIGREANFRINHLYTSSDGQYTILINQISDSRCPEGMQCDWQGEISLRGEWTVDKNKTTFELHSVLKDLQKEPHGFTIQIVDAKPYPRINNESRPDDLVVTLLIQKK